MSSKNQPQYKRGTIIKNGKRYGFYPDGSLYRIYSTSDRPFLEIVDIEGKTFLRIRQATEAVAVIRISIIAQAHTPGVTAFPP